MIIEAQLEAKIGVIKNLIGRIKQDQEEDREEIDENIADFLDELQVSNK